MTDEPLHTLKGLENVVRDITNIRNGVVADGGALFQRGETALDSANGAIESIYSGLTDVLWDEPSIELSNPSVTAKLPYLPIPSFSEIKGGSSDFDPDAIPEYLSRMGTVSLDVALPAAPASVDVVLPTAPVVSFGNAPAKPDIDISLDLPTRPTVAIGSAPQMHGITLPSLPAITMPTLDVSFPQWVDSNPDLPNIGAVSVTLDRTAFDAFVNKTLDGVPQTLLDVTTQEVGRIADQHRSSAQRDIEAVFEEFSVRGFTAPPGAIGRRTDAIRADASAKVRLASRDVAISRMQMEVEVFKANLATGAQLVQKDVELTLQEHRLTLDIYTAAGKQMLDLYNANVEVFKAKQTAYQAIVDVFKARIQGELSKVDLYKAEMDGAKATLEVDNMAMRGYETQLSGVRASVDVYRAIVDAARTELDAKAKQMDMFRSEVEAYAASVNAGKVRFDAYDTQVKAALAPLQIYEQQIKGYSANVDGVKTVIQAKTLESSQMIAEEDARLKAYVAKVDAISKNNIARIEKDKLAYSEIGLRIDYEIKKVSASADLERISLERARNDMAAATSVAEVQLKLLESKTSWAQRKAELRQDALKAAAQVSGQLASSALAGFHVQQSISAAANTSFQGQSSGHWNFNKQDKA